MPGPAKDVDPVNGLGAEGHRGDGLDAAEQVDLVGAGQVHRGDGRGRDLAADRWRAGRDARHAGHLGGDDRHVRRRGERVAPAGHVGAGGTDRDVLLTEEDAGLRLDLEVGHRVALGLGEAAHVGLHGLDVVDDLSGTVAMISAISASLSRKLSGDQLSNFSEYSRTAASPRSRMSAITPFTVSATEAGLCTVLPDGLLIVS